MIGGWFQITLWKRVLIGLALGLVVGLAIRYGIGPEAAAPFADAWLKPFGDAFVNLIKMLVVPLIFTTLVAGVTAMGDPARLGGLGGRAIAMYLVTTWFAVSLGLLMGTIFQPGAGVDASAFGPTADCAAVLAGEIEADANVREICERVAAAQGANATVAAKLLAIIPTNPVEALAETNVLAIIFFAILFGVGCLLAGEKGRPVAAAIESAADVMLKVTVMVMELAPFGVFFLMSWIMAKLGISILDNLGLLAIALYLACALHIVIVYGLGIVKLLLRLPLVRFFRGIADAQAVAYSTASSSGTLPVTIANVSENLGVKKSVAASVLPVGATINMDGTAIYLGLVALFAAQALNLPITPEMYVGVALAATLTSIGAAGIPSAGLLLATVVMTEVGVPPEQAVVVIAFIFPFDRLLDMMRTMTNVTGDAAIASAVAKWEDELDEEVFRSPAVV
ncbi:MAG: dicarboxylate/amino acid:cation symporter [Pseudomonadota bacterium]